MNHGGSFVQLDSRGRIDPPRSPPASGASAAATPQSRQDRPRRFGLIRGPGFLRKWKFRAPAEETGKNIPLPEESPSSDHQDTNVDVCDVPTNVETGRQDATHPGRVNHLVQKFDAGVGKPSETRDVLPTSQNDRVMKMVQELEKRSAQDMGCDRECTNAVPVPNKSEIETSPLIDTPASSSPIIPSREQNEDVGEHGDAPEESCSSPPKRRHALFKFIRRIFGKRRFRRLSAKRRDESTPRCDMTAAAKTTTDILGKVGEESAEIVTQQCVEGVGISHRGGVFKRAVSLNSTMSSAPNLNPAPRQSRRDCNKVGCVSSRSDRGSGELSVPELMVRSSTVSRTFPDRLTAEIGTDGAGGVMPNSQTNTSSLECVSSSLLEELCEDNSEGKKLLRRMSEVQRASYELLEQINALREKIQVPCT